MRLRPLGKTGLQVSELSLGGLFVSSHGGNFAQGRAAIRRAFDLGVNYIDTAPSYRDSEEVLGKVLPDIDGPCYLSTKVGGRPSPFEPQNPDHLRQSVEESLRLLKRDHIDLLMVHEPERPGHYDWWADRRNYSGPVIDVLDELKERGIVRLIGLGGTTAYAMAPIMETGRFDVVLTAFNYSLLWREAEHAILPTAKRLGMGVVIGSPLQQGVLSRRHDAEVEAGPHWLSPPRRRQLLELYGLLDEIDMSLPEISLRFVLSNPNISCTLMGARSEEEVERNIAAAAQGPLAPEILARLDQLVAMVPFRPTDEPACLPLGRDYPGLGPVR